MMDIFSFIKSNINILDVAQQYASLKKAGLYWKGHCPFHHEKTASFTVSPHRNIFYCFGCSSGGDVITFISKVEQCSALEATKLLADRYNISLPKESGTITTHAPTDERERYFKLCELVSTWCCEQLEKSPLAKEYLESRAITHESTAYFTIGFFPSGPSSVQSLIRYAQKNNVLADDLLSAHVLSKAKRILYSPFEGRIIFPIKDHLGRFCGFGGRIFKPEDNRAKYYNSKENSHFAKSHLLFGFDLAKKAIQKAKSAFIVEGYTDCVAMYQHGYKNSIATLGTACTQEHLQLISRYAEQLYVLYDGDSAGTQAILRLATLCWQVDIDLKIIVLPPSEDPATYLHKHSTIKPLISQAKEIFDFFIDTIAHNFHEKGLKQKLTVSRKIIAVIAQMKDPLKQDLLIQRAAKAFELPFESIKGELRRTANSERSYGVREPSISNTPLDTETDNIDQMPTLEKRIFFAIMHNMQLITKENEDDIIACLPTPLNTIIQELIHRQSTQSATSFNQFFDQLDAKKQQIVSQLLVSFNSPVDKDEFNQLFIQLQKKHWKRIVKNIKAKIEYAKKTGDQESVNTILHRFIKIKKQMTRGLL